MKTRLPSLLVMTCLLCGCILFEPRVRKTPEGVLPEAFSIVQIAPMPSRWWETFSSPELNALVEAALSDTGSLTLAEAWARLDQFRAQTAKTGADLYPDLTFTPGYSHTRQDTTLKGTETIRKYSLALATRYELDLWGRIRSLRTAAAMETQASEADVAATAMTLAASVTETWLNVISQRRQKQLLERQLESNKVFLELIELRFRKSLVSALDVYQQKQAVAQVAAAIPLATSRERQSMHELALLLGKPPRTPLKIGPEKFPEIDGPPPTGLPANLLSARPDVRAARMRLQASDWEVSAARADRMPALRLTAQAEYSGDEISRIFDNWMVNLAGSLTGPIFDGWRRKAEVDRTRAVVQERLAAYKRTVLTAVKEVEDALVREETQRQFIAALTAEFDAARNASREAGERYLKGLNDYLPVLTALLTRQRLERELIEAKAQLLIDRVGLHRALGGSWTQGLDPTGLTLQSERQSAGRNTDDS